MATTALILRADPELLQLLLAARPADVHVVRLTPYERRKLLRLAALRWQHKPTADSTTLNGTPLTGRMLKQATEGIDVDAVVARRLAAQAKVLPAPTDLSAL